MQRREALKVMAVTTAFMGTVASAYDEKLITNKNDMAIKDPANPTEFELKHLPEITIKDTDAAGFTLVEVTVGQKNIIHPSVDNHWIYEIELFADDKLVSKMSLEPSVSRGFLSTRVKLKDVKTLKSIARCNLHGNFTAMLNL